MKHHINDSNFNEKNDENESYLKTPFLKKQSTKKYVICDSSIYSSNFWRKIQQLDEWRSDEYSSGCAKLAHWSHLRKATSIF